MQGTGEPRSRVGDSSRVQDFYCGGVTESLAPHEFVERLRYQRSSLSSVNGANVVVVDCTRPEWVAVLGAVHRDEVTDLPTLLVGWGAEIHEAPSAVFDAVLDDEPMLESFLLRVAERPHAAVATALLLRGVDQRSVEDSLVAESTTYSVLQSGPEFRTWQESRPSPAAVAGLQSPSETVIVERTGEELSITLNRPERRNAYSSAMRSALADALEVAVLDTNVKSVTLRGAGRNFSSGGDLDEFGQFSDPVTAHFSRLTSRVTRSLWMLRQRLGPDLHCMVQGANHGAGVELAAFAGRVSATADATFTLPEVRMGLVPGSGGTASLPLRIGRHRTLVLAVTGSPIDAATAREWGLVDDIVI